MARKIRPFWAFFVADKGQPGPTRDDREPYMTKEMTGAEMVIEALADQGVEHLFGYPGGAVLPIYDALFQQEQVQPHPGAPRAGRGACGRRLCALDRQGRLRAGDLRSRRDQCGHRADRRADGFDPARLHHRAGADASDRQRRLPGMRHGRHHAALHQAQLSGEARSRICRACCTRRSTSRRAAGPARSWSTSRRTSSSPRASTPGPKEFQHKGYRPKLKGDLEKIKAAIELMANAKRPLFYTGGGVINSGPAASQLLRELVQADRLSRSPRR